jgi:hypothetical protein
VTGKITGWSGLSQRYWTSISKTLIDGVDIGVVIYKYMVKNDGLVSMTPN